VEFRKYMHVERFGNDEVQGIELGDCYIFPKLDGTNASTWLSPDGDLCAGSRNRELSIDRDNAGFFGWAVDRTNILDFHLMYPHLTLYGEWLVPHSLKTYREEAWRNFYVFDVWDWSDNCYLHYEAYLPLLVEYDIDCIPAVSTIKNGAYDQFLKQLDQNIFLIEDGKGVGEGIVIKNYNFQNKFGRTTWAKLITNTFKDTNIKAFGPTVKQGKQMVEQEIVETYITKHLIDKVYSKIVNSNDGWNSRYIPQLLGTVFHDLVTEELWDIIKKFKNPTVNFKTLNTLTIMKIKELRSELF